jgi:uncharacterized protein with HEPN domain
MSKKIDDVYLLDMQAYAEKIRALTSRISRSEFEGDEEHQAAIAHWLQTVGEAATRLSPGFRENHPAIDWRKIIGMRNVIVHRYAAVDLDLVWAAATEGVETLLGHLLAIRSR